MGSSPTNTAPGSAGQNGARLRWQDLAVPTHDYGRRRVLLERAAPDLLEALRECVDKLDELGVSASFEPVRSALSAIAKATGEGV